MLKKVLLTKVNVGDARSGVTQGTGKEWTAWPVGIEVDGVWYNGFLFDKPFVDELAAHKGKEMVIDLFEEEYQGQLQKKFQKPEKEDAFMLLFNELQSRIEVLEEKVGIEFVASTTLSEKEEEPEQTALQTFTKYLEDNKEKLPKKIYDEALAWTNSEGIKTAAEGQLGLALKKLEENILPF